MHRTSIALMAAAIALAAAAVPAAGQDRPRAPQGDRQWIASGAAGLDPVERERRVREWEEIVEEMTRAEREAFMLLPQPEKAQVIRALVQQRQRDQEQAFLDSLPEETRSEIAPLPARARAVRILELRIDQELERLVLEARDRGLLTEEAAAAALGDPGAKARAARVLDLQKAVFLDIHREALEALPEGKRKALREMKPGEFFRSPFAAELKARRLFTMRGLVEVRSAGPGRIEDLLSAIAAGRMEAEWRPSFRAGALEEALALPPAARERLVRELRRTCFFRDLPPDAVGAPPGRRAGARAGPDSPDPVQLPRGLWRALTPDEQRAFFRMSPRGRMNFAMRRFPEWWTATRGAASAGGPGTLRDLTRRAEGLPPPDRDRVLDLSLPDAVRELTRPDRPGAAPDRSDHQKNPVKDAIDGLTPAQRKEFEALPGREAKLDYLRRNVPGFREGPNDPPGPHPRR